MSVSNGQDASEEILNDAFLSRTTNTSTTGKLALRNADSAAVEDPQAKINELLSSKTSNDVKNDQQDARLDSLEASLPLSNFAATAEPTSSNDITESYAVGSYWYNTTTGFLYVCTNASEGEAVWSDINVVKIKDWAATTKYLQNQTVLNEGVIYRAIATFVSGETFDNTKWQAIGAAGSGGGSLSTYHTNDAEGFDGSEFSCLDGGVIGAGSVIISFVTMETTEPLSGDQSFLFTIPASGTGKYCLIDSSNLIPVPRYARNGINQFSFVAGGDFNSNDFSLFLWDTTAGATIKNSDGNTAFISPRENIGNALRFATNGTENLQWGVYINTDNTGATLKIDNVEFTANPDKSVEINRVVQSLSRSGNDGRAITASTESIPFGTGTDSANGWTYGADGSTTTNGNYYTVQSSNSIVSIDGSIQDSTGPTMTVRLFLNGSYHKTIGLANVSGRGEHKFTYTSSSGEFSAGDKLAFIASEAITLTNVDFGHYLNIVETASSNNVIVANTNDKLAYVYAAGGSGGVDTSTDINFTEVDDNNGRWDGTTFTANRDMIIHASGSILFTTNTNGAIRKYISGVAGDYVSYEVTQDAYMFSTLQKLSAGQTFSLRPSASLTISNDANYHNITIQELPSEDLIYAYLDESRVGANYNSTSGASVANAANFLFETKRSDTNDAYNTSTGVYTIPVSGAYSISAQGRNSSAATLGIDIHVNGTKVAEGYSSSSNTDNVPVSIDYIELQENDEVSIRNSSGSARSLTTGTGANNFSIHRIR